MMIHPLHVTAIKTLVVRKLIHKYAHAHSAHTHTHTHTHTSFTLQMYGAVVSFYEPLTEHCCLDNMRKALKANDKVLYITTSSLHHH